MALVNKGDQRLCPLPSPFLPLPKQGCEEDLQHHGVEQIVNSRRRRHSLGNHIPYDLRSSWHGPSRKSSTTSKRHHHCSARTCGFTADSSPRDGDCRGANVINDDNGTEQVIAQGGAENAAGRAAGDAFHEPEQPASMDACEPVDAEEPWPDTGDESVYGEVSGFFARGLKLAAGDAGVPGLPKVSATVSIVAASRTATASVGIAPEEDESRYGGYASETYGDRNIPAPTAGDQDADRCEQSYAIGFAQWPPDGEDVEDFGVGTGVRLTDVLWAEKRTSTAAHARAFQKTTKNSRNQCLSSSPHTPFAPHARDNNDGCLGSSDASSRPSPAEVQAIAVKATPAKAVRIKVAASDKAVAASGGTLSSEDFTTIMIRNLPVRLTQQRLMQELADTGFAGAFDFCYMPFCFNSGEGKGFAFVNFITPPLARVFMSAWRGVRPFGIGASEQALNISYGALQGLDANIARWDSARMRRVKNPELRPFILKYAESDAARSPQHRTRRRPN